MRSRNEELGIIIKHLTFNEPYYGLFTMMLNKLWTKDEIDTAGVKIVNNINYELLINENFWDKQSEEMKQSVLLHEILHIVFNHPLIKKKSYDQQLFNIACDIEVNQYIDKVGDTWCTLDKFPELNMQRKKGAIWYYEELQKQCNNKNTTCNILLDKGEAITKNGKCTLPQHNWKQFDEMSDVEKEMIQNQVNHLIKQTAQQIKNRGNIPAEIEEILERINKVKKSKFNWRAYIRRYAGNATKSFVKSTRRKENKRINGQPTIKVKYTQRILVGIDTSGSVSTQELNEFLNEITFLSKLGHDIEIVECDAKMTKPFKFNRHIDFNVYGRGGTAFQPICDYYAEHINRYACLIYFTDGECHAPEVVRGNILWVLSSQSKMNDELPGKVIKIEYDER